MSEPTEDVKNTLCETIWFNLNDMGEPHIFQKPYLLKALMLSLWDANLATARILESVATQKAMAGKRAMFGNVSIDNSIADLRQIANYWRSRVGEDKGKLPPIYTLHGDGTVGDGRSEFDKIGIKDVEEGERLDENLKIKYGSGEEL